MNDQSMAMVADSSGGSAVVLTVPDESHGQRLDHFLARSGNLEALSRSAIQQLIKTGMVLLGGKAVKGSCRLRQGDVLSVILPEVVPSELVPEEVPFDVLFEDDDLIVLSKPPGIVVHPAAGHRSGTLVHGLLHHCDALAGISGVQRPGIVHRLDMDTSGVMVVAKSDRAHAHLVDAFKERLIRKVYHAIASGSPKDSGGRVDLPIGRHPVHRKKMAVLSLSGREAVTEWRVLERFGKNLCYLELMPRTGRTHQLRVHMAHLGLPLAGDPIYGGRQAAVAGIAIPRLCLHALSLSFEHPVTGHAMTFSAPIWPDMAGVLERLRRNTGSVGVSARP